MSGMSDAFDAAKAELDYVRAECLKLISDVKAFCPVPVNGQYPEVFRLMATPMLYSAWERTFTLCHSIALRLLRSSMRNPAALAPSQRAIWFMRASCFSSFRDRWFEAGLNDKGPKRGRFTAVCDFLQEFEAWCQDPFDLTGDTEELVMTFSNVNPEVVEVNAKAIGFAETAAFGQCKFGRLNDLVGRRNDIGHGSTIEAPKHEAFVQLIAFAEELIGHYCDCAQEWVDGLRRATSAAPAASEAAIAEAVVIGKVASPLSYE